MSEPLIRVQHLAKTYHDGERELRILTDVSCAFEAGEAVAIVGQSGCGKSTLLNLLGALDRPTSGKIVLEGQDLAAMSGHALNTMRLNHMGFIFQFHHLLPELRAWENVAMPRLIVGEASGEAKRKAMELLDRVGLADRANHIPAKLSGGEQQRVSLARALANDPRVILADEPTGNLDEEMGQQVMNLLWEMTRGRNRLLIIVTHEKRIAQNADRTLLLHAGQLEKV
jgi:lipoprotein-releasing system ATP-binding protein